MRNEPKKKLDILYIVQYFIPAQQFGGVVQLTYNIAKGMVQKGHNVTIFTSDVLELKKRINEKAKIIDGIKIYYFKNWSNFIGAKYRISQPRKLKTVLKKKIKEFDVVHILDIYSISSIWAYKYSRKWNIPLFITINGVLSDYSQKVKGLGKKLFNIIMKKILRNAQGVIVQTESEKKDCERFGLNNLNLINIGINLKEFNNLPSRNVFRKKYNIKDDDLIILFLGRIDKVKGIKYLIEAIYKIRNSKIFLYIVGPRNNSLNALLKLIKKYDLQKRIRIIDGLYDTAKIEAYMGADIYCLPSIYDCAPNSLLEACACGLPIITTSSNGLFEIAENGAGIVIKPRDSNMIKEAILKMVSNKEKMIKMGKLGKNIVQKEYNLSKILNKLENLYLLKNS